ncbi:iron complex outermembrane recepter protein [Xylanibacter ruminicola]|uniref:Iron complex outermembrane recepter protein n=1 Tax=Xylanibacter ruminicola TaxID=839 RepID=A0A1M7HYY1_XYLRU|nr:TonB-dependent receptor [Xylanibacter ruminicola]SHM33599.1 iron complex outermembrane recepter protein [Xylanibacter ruminicola]
MKRVVLGMAALVCAAGANAQNKAALYDSTQVEALNEIVVKGVRTQKNAPFAVANIKKKELNAFSNTGKELPFLFSQTPGILAWSENGLGTGTTYMRIRGAGDSRINVTLDGVPLNSPEDQCVFWANMNSYGSLLGSVQIQRGVGTSTNGDGAFGGTVALASATPSQQAGGEVSASYGSFNTFNVGGKFSTGLLWNHLIFDGAYHETNTDGFIHGTSGRSGSYYGGLTWIGDKFQIRYKNIGNFEKTGQAWNGVTAGDNDMSLMDGTYGSNTGIKTYKDMWNAGLGKYNSLYEYLTGYEKDANGNYPTARYQMNDGSYWPKTTDNFWQNHNILSAAYDINDNWSMTGSLHYTHGYGYYNEFRFQNKLKKFGMTYDGVKKTDFVRQKGLSQNTYGFIWNVNYKNDSWDVIGGMSLQEFDGNHFGYITYIANDAVRQKYMPTDKYKYYDSDATKFDGSAFVKAAYHINEHWDVFGDLQYRYVQYESNGINDKFYEEGSSYYNQRLDIDQKYRFLNPKAGFSWNLNNHRVYGSVALSHREPERNNFTDNGAKPFPKSESLMDYELGYTFNNDIFHFGVNLYYMDYTNQFVQTGEKSDIGENLTTNIKDSYRMGVEIQGGVDVTSWLSIEGNAALSQNKIKDFDEVASVNWEDDFRTIHYDNSTLAFSPSTILNGFVNLHWNGLQAVWHTNFVSRQYLDNTENADRSLPCYSASDANISYTWKPNKAIKECIFGLNFNNIFNRRYAANGWVYSSIVEEYGHPNENRYYQIGFIPMAGFTMMGNVTLRF